VTGGDESPSGVNLSSSNIVTVILSVLTPLVSETQVNTSVYFGTLTVVNICLGIAATVLTWLVGLPHPFLWGMLAAVLNFIPYVGAAIVIATLFVVGLLVFSTLSHAVIAPLAYLGITALEGQCITPTLLGHRLTINPFLVFLSIACWSWMWGPVGAFLGVPISCARWWRCAGCHRQAARMPGFTRPLRIARGAGDRGADRATHTRWPTAKAREAFPVSCDSL
jgi:hypothetical protein